MSFTLQRYVSNLFLLVILEAGVCRLLGRVVKNGEVIKTFETIFDNPDDDKIDDKVIAYLKDKKDEYYDIYTALYSNSVGQGAISGTENRDYEYYSVDVKNVTRINLENDWSAYISYIDLKWAKNMLNPYELDLLYSPFVLLSECVKKSEPKDKPILYIYNHEDSFAVGIFKKYTLIFGAFFRTRKSIIDIAGKFEQDWSEAEEEKGIDNLVDLDSVKEPHHEEVEEYESLDDLDDTLDENIDFDLESNDAIEDNIDDSALEQSFDNAEESMALLGRDMAMYNYLVNAIKDFYGDTHYKHDFIEDVIIFDNHEITEALITMIEGELLMNVKVEKIKTLELMYNLARKDLGL